MLHILHALKSEVFIPGEGGGWGTRPPLSEFSRLAPDVNDRISLETITFNYFAKKWIATNFATWMIWILCYCYFYYQIYRFHCYLPPNKAINTVADNHTNHHHSIRSKLKYLPWKLAVLKKLKLQERKFAVSNAFILFYLKLYSHST